ncbi:MAG TPA: IS1595 family transposase [Rhizomicrobium sp.]
MTCDLPAPIFTNEAKAIEHLEASRWPNGVTCPHCGADNVHKMAGKTQAGMFQCNACRDKFTCRTGTVFERSHIPVHKWLLATHLVASSKKGISAHQLHRMLGITYKSAWFMEHRIRAAMAPAKKEPMGGEGKTVEADETYIGKKPGRKVKVGWGHKHTVVSLVERGGSVRSFHVRGNMDRRKAGKVLFRNVDLATALMTDEASLYKAPGDFFASHDVVTHSKGEYVRGSAHTNTIEGYFSIFKRGMNGVYQHCSERHLHRYLAEFDFRYSNRVALGVSDAARAARILKGAEGKRLTYRQPH